MNRCKNILLTGATGFVGSEFLRYFLNDVETKNIFVLLRSRVGVEPVHRLDGLIAKWKKFFNIDVSSLKKIKIIDLDLPIGAILQLIDAPVDLAIHCAASTDFGLPLAPSRVANLQFTQKVLTIAEQLPGLARFLHFSTAYVLSSRRGIVLENQRPLCFANAYEQSKYEAEQCVRSSAVPYTILRPTMIVGDSRTGYILGFKVLYTVFRMWLSGRIPRSPLDAKSKVDIVPIDYVVQASLALAQDAAAANEIFHVSSGEMAVAPTELFAFASKVFALPHAQIVSSSFLPILKSRWLRPFLGYALREMIELMEWHIPYLGTRDRFFSSDKTMAILKRHGITLPLVDDYAPRLFSFCKDSQWGKIPLHLRS